MGYYSINFKPDLVDGDISNIIQSGKTDLAFGANDILFDWHAVDVPRGAAKLVSICVYSSGEDGGTQTISDYSFLFAKTENGVAPTSLGAVNAAQTTGFDMPTHLIGATVINATTDDSGHVFGPAFGTIVHTASSGSSEGGFAPIIIEGEPNTGATVGFDKIYIAVFCKAGPDYSTGVLLNDGSNVADDAGTSLTVDGQDPRKVFQVGDTVYVHDVDTAVGTVASMTATTIVLTSNNVGAIADDDELINANPIKLILGFEQ